jgi:hypothetical protein
VQSHWEWEIYVLSKCFIVLIARIHHQKLYHALLRAEEEKKKNMHRPAAENNKTQTPQRRNQTPETTFGKKTDTRNPTHPEENTHQRMTPERQHKNLSSPKLHACC